MAPRLRWQKGPRRAMWQGHDEDGAIVATIVQEGPRRFEASGKRWMTHEASLAEAKRAAEAHEHAREKGERWLPSSRANPGSDASNWQPWEKWTAGALAVGGMVLLVRSLAKGLGAAVGSGIGAGVTTGGSAPSGGSGS